MRNCFTFNVIIIKEMRKVILFTSTLTVLLLTSSCATIFTGKTTKVTFKSNVDGKVYQNLIEIGKTNQEIVIKKKDLPKLYTVKAPNCTDKQFELPVKASLAPMMNLLNLNLLASIDYMNGCHLKTDKVITVDLECSRKK